MLPVCYQGLDLPAFSAQVPSLYLVQAAGTPTYTKIGVSNRPTVRLSSLQSGHPLPFEHVVLYGFEKPRAASDAERIAHQELQEYRVRAEWFHGSVPDFHRLLLGKLKPAFMLEPRWSEVMERWGLAKSGPLGALGGSKTEIIELYHSGATAAEIAERFKVSPQAVSTRLRSWGYVLRPRGRRRKEAVA